MANYENDVVFETVREEIYNEDLWLEQIRWANEFDVELECYED